MKKQTTKGRKGLVLYIIFAVLLVLCAFSAGRCTGIKQGHHDAALEIEQRGNVTAGPDSII